MREIKLFVLVIFGLSITFLNLQADYLDVGDDPSKIEIVTTQEINIPSDYYFEGWSPEGDYFIFSKEDPEAKEFKTTIFYKGGQLYKEYTSYSFCIWTLDSTKIVVKDSSNRFWLLKITTNLKEKIEITYDSSINNFCINPENGNLYYNIRTSIYEYDFASKKSQLIYTHQIDSSGVDLITSTNNVLFYTQFKEEKFQQSLFQLNKSTKSVKEIIEGCGSIKHFKTKQKDIYLIYQKGSYIYIVNENNELKFKLLWYRDVPIPELPGETMREFYARGNLLSPNGKLFAVSAVVYNPDGSTEIIIGNIHIFNLRGEMTKLTDNRENIELVLGWSPMGDNLIYYDSDREKNKYYLMKIAKKK